MKGFHLFLASFLLLPLVSLAYGPRSVSKSGNAVKWSSMPVRVDLESDLNVRGKDVTSLVTEALDTWKDLSDSDITFNQQSLGVAVDQTNKCCYLYDSAACPNGPQGDGLNPLVIDDDGEIVSDFFGAGNQYTTLGFAAIVVYNSQSGAAVKGEAVFNAACLSGVRVSESSCGSLNFSDNDFTSFIVHEIGHFLGFNHTQTTLREAEGGTAAESQDIPTMYPLFPVGFGAEFKTPERDDAVAAAFLYPSSSFSSSTFTASGTVFDTNGTKEFACANVIARNSNSDLATSDAVSFVSGQMCPDEVFDGSCDGDFQIQGLDPSQTYTLEVEAILSKFSGSSGLPPCEGSGQRPTFTAQTLPGTVSAAAGSTSSANNFTLTNTSGNVNSLALARLDFWSDSPSTPPLASKAILEIEVKTASESCATTDSTGTSSTNGSGGCQLIK